MVTIDSTKLGFETDIEIKDKEVKLIGFLSEWVARELSMQEFDILDVSEVEFEVGEKKDHICLGWSHCGPVYGREYMRKIDSFMDLVDGLTVKRFILPASLTRKQLNAIKRNDRIKTVTVPDDARLFSMKDGNVYNRKGTILMFQNINRK